MRALLACFSYSVRNICTARAFSEICQMPPTQYQRDALPTTPASQTEDFQLCFQSLTVQFSRTAVACLAWFVRNGIRDSVLLLFCYDDDVSVFHPYVSRPGTCNALNASCHASPFRQVSSTQLSVLSKLGKHCIIIPCTLSYLSR